jgi:hypothetical protein
MQSKTQEKLFAEWRELGDMVGRLAQAHTNNEHLAHANTIIESIESANQLWYAPADEVAALMEAAVLATNFDETNSVLLLDYIDAWKASLDILSYASLVDASVQRAIVVHFLGQVS